MRIKVKGVDPVLAMLNRAETVPEKVDRLRREFAFSTFGNIQRLTIKGRGKDSGGLRRSNVAPSIFGATVQFVNVAYYAIYVEFGTGRRGAASFKSYIPAVEMGIAYALYWPGMEGMPFMRPAIAEGIEEVGRKLDDLGKEVAG